MARYLALDCYNFYNLVMHDLYSSMLPQEDSDSNLDIDSDSNLDIGSDCSSDIFPNNLLNHFQSEIDASDAPPYEFNAYEYFAARGIQYRENDRDCWRQLYAPNSLLPDYFDQHIDNQPEDQHIDNQPEDQHIDNQPEDQHIDNQPEDQYIDNQPEDQYIDNQPEDQYIDNQPEDHAYSSIYHQIIADEYSSHYIIQDLIFDMLNILDY